MFGLRIYRARFFDYDFGDQHDRVVEMLSKKASIAEAILDNPPAPVRIIDSGRDEWTVGQCRPGGLHRVLKTWPAVTPAG